MQLSDFDYDLPDELIARYPAAERRGSRLLVVDPATDAMDDRRFADLPGLLTEGDLLVFNDTRVLKARLPGRKASGGRIEVLIERVEGDSAALAQVRASKAPKAGGRLDFAGGTSAIVDGRDGEFYRLLFDRPLLPFLERHGEVPLAPFFEPGLASPLAIGRHLLELTSR